MKSNVDQEFEAWATHPDRHGKLPIEAHANGAYKDPRTYAAYYGWISGWKASREIALTEAATICGDQYKDSIRRSLKYEDASIAQRHCYVADGAANCMEEIKEILK
jgi:hypothetical protein